MKKDFKEIKLTNDEILTIYMSLKITQITKLQENKNNNREQKEEYDRIARIIKKLMKGD